MNHTVKVNWNPDGTVDQVSMIHCDGPWPEHDRCILVIEDMGGGEWDVHIGPPWCELHLSLGRKGIVIEAPDRVLPTEDGR